MKFFKNFALIFTVLTLSTQLSFPSLWENFKEKTKAVKAAIAKKIEDTKKNTERESLLKLTGNTQYYLDEVSR